MISKTLVSASNKPLVLLILRGGENYGYRIIQYIRQISGGRLEWSAPMLYALLQRMERDGLVQSSWKFTDRNRPRKCYRLTDKRLNKQEKVQWMMVTKAIQKLLDTVSPVESQS